MATVYTITHDFATDDLIVADYVDANFNDLLAAVNALDAGNLASGTVALARISGLTSSQCASAFFKDEDAMTSDSATAVSSQQAIKYFVNNNRTGWTPSITTGLSFSDNPSEQSITFPNGLIFKSGYIAYANPSAITFGTAFPNAILSVFISGVNASMVECDAITTSATKTGFTIHDGNSKTGHYWQAWGR